MTKTEKQRRIKYLVEYLLKESYKEMSDKIDKVLNSGCIDIENWDEEYQMILPKSIATALLKGESDKYLCKGTTFEKKIKKDSKNIIHFI